MNQLTVELRRGDLVESVHRVSVAVVDGSGRLIAGAGNPELVTYWRSAAKPFQALPLVEDGVLTHYELSDDALALACASHSSEAVHLQLTDRILRQVGCREDDLACGPHQPLSPRVARDVAASRTLLTPRWSNCSGKHAGMLALARHHGWEIRGYERAGHPVQQRIRQAIQLWTGLAPEQIVDGTDGCTTVCFGIPVVAMARAYAALAAGKTESLRRVRQAMLAHPALIAGEGRFCTEVMQALPGALIVKVGAEGIHCAAVPGAGIGIALKVEDGENRASGPALLATLEALASRLTAEARLKPEQLRHWRRAVVRNTRDEPVGEIRAAGALQFFNAS